jgi:hypothetical protein
MRKNPIEGLQIEYGGQNVDQRQKDDSAPDEGSGARALRDSKQPEDQKGNNRNIEKGSEAPEFGK